MSDGKGAVVVETEAKVLNLASASLTRLKTELAAKYNERTEVAKAYNAAARVANSVKTLAASAEVARLVALRENIDQGLMLVLAEAVFKGHKFTTQDLQFLQLKLGGLTEQEKVADQAVRAALVAKVERQAALCVQGMETYKNNLQLRTITVLELLGCKYKLCLISKLPAIPVAPPVVPPAPPTIPDPSTPIVPEVVDSVTPSDPNETLFDKFNNLPKNTKLAIGALAVGAVWYFTRKK